MGSIHFTMAALTIQAFLLLNLGSIVFALTAESLIKPELRYHKIIINDMKQFDDNHDELNRGNDSPSNIYRSDSKCGCGQSIDGEKAASGRIINGMEVNPKHSLPYQVLLKTRMGNAQGVGGGTIINKKYVMTAAHNVCRECVIHGKKFACTVHEASVTLGIHKLPPLIYNIYSGAIPVSQIIVHEGYIDLLPGHLSNDIALLKLKRDIYFNDYIIPACLPTNTHDLHTGKSAIASGWGLTRNRGSGGQLSNVLLMIKLKIIAAKDPTCFAWDNKKQICAYGKGNMGAGDSGGPLVTKEDGKNTVVGVISHKNYDDNPGIYTSVTGHLRWIEQRVADGWCS